MDDLKELLTLAARAMGLTIVRWQQDDFPVIQAQADLQCGWQPIWFAGDGAEMEDRLRISVHRIPDGVCSYVDGAVGLYQRYEMHADHSTEGHARRWASLRVAAAIGRSMK
jgi:hypothetical protein